MLIEKNTAVLVQGITGKEGEKAARAMMDYGTTIVGGVRPGKGGETVLGKPVFNTVQEAKEACPHITTTTIYVPPFAAKTAIMEAIDANIPIINTIVERIPIQDTAYCLAAAKEKNIHIVGPSSLGYIRPGLGRVGVVGGLAVRELYEPGGVGIISRSGGMTNEISWQVKKKGLGQSMAIHVGGDVLLGTTYADLLAMFEQDEQTKAVVIFGEHGGQYEFEIVDMIQEKKFTKPLAIYIGGKFANALPEGVNIGHAGAIVEKGKGAAEKEKALEQVGVLIASRYEELVELVSPFAI